MNNKLSYYYQLNGKSSREVGDHEGLIFLKSLCLHANKVLDVGCGEGSRLNTLLPSNKKGWGIDISSDGIAAAVHQYPKYTFKVADASHIPFADNSFDLVYTAYVLEHTTDPQAVVNEMIRVCKKQGRIVILCPNFGAPNRRSPRSMENPLLKMLNGILHEYDPEMNINWKSVTPASVFVNPDDDTTIEPYLHSLIKYLRSKNLFLEVTSSLWSQESKSLNPRKLIIKLLGQMKIPPFIYWGPQIFIVARK